ncbi:MAG: SRPBCC family protein [Desulfosarcinaceae bacterium]
MKRPIFLSLALVLLLLTGPTGCTAPQSRIYKRYAHYDGEINQHMRLIQAPPDVIFNLITNPEEFTAMVPAFTSVSFDTPPPYQVGTRLKIRINHLLKFTWHTQVREMIPNRKTRLEFLDGLFEGGTEIWELQPEGRGTRVIQTIIVSPKSLPFAVIWSLKARNRHNEMTEKFLDNLQARAESIENG